MNLYNNAMKQLESAASIMNLDKDILTILKTPERIITAWPAIKMDDGSLKIFQSYRVQYSSICGPYKGGIRFYPKVNLEDIKALAFWMTIKTSLVDIPMGGGKGGIIVDSKTLSKKEIEKLSRAWTKSFVDVIGPKKDIPAPDLYTNSQIMAYIADEYSKLIGKKSIGVVTGKPVEKGGSKGRDTATATGGFYILQAVIKKLKLGNNLSVAIQGFGNAGSVIAKLLYDYKYKIIALSDSKTALFDKNGINIDRALEYKKKNKTLNSFNNYKSIKKEKLLTLNTDILIPAALENQINKKNVNKIKAKIILELANGPITFDADKVLNKKGLIIIPDVLANAGGVVVSYFECLQNLNNIYWTKKTVNCKLKEKMLSSWDLVWKISKKYNINIRRAAFIGALEKISYKIKDNY